MKSWCHFRHLIHHLNDDFFYLWNADVGLDTVSLKVNSKSINGDTLSQALYKLWIKRLSYQANHLRVQLHGRLSFHTQGADVKIPSGGDIQTGFSMHTLLPRGWVCCIFVYTVYECVRSKWGLQLKYSITKHAATEKLYETNQRWKTPFRVHFCVKCHHVFF